mgnify:CR=1 FL=1
MINTVGLSLVDKNSTDYFDRLFDKVIEARMKEHSGSDFVQSLTDKLVDPTSSTMQTDETGTKWTKDGTHALSSCSSIVV